MELERGKIAKHSSTQSPIWLHIIFTVQFRRYKRGRNRIITSYIKCNCRVYNERTFVIAVDHNCISQILPYFFSLNRLSKFIPFYNTTHLLRAISNMTQHDFWIRRIITERYRS